MKKLEIKEVQFHLLNIMKEIALICDKNNIPYYLSAGSMIGAIRHRGFIPWDDDIDIAIPRPYYDKFLEIVNKELPSFLSANSYKNSESYIYSFIKVEDKRTEIDFPWTRGCSLTEGLYVDVFVLDGTSRNDFWRKCYFFYIQRLIAFKGALFMNADQRPFIKRFISKILKKIIFIKKHKLISFIDNQMQRYPYYNSESVVNYNGFYGIREIISLKVLGKPTIYQFEDTKLYGVEDFDSYLKNLYGDYMKLPPEEKRFNHSLSVKFKE